MIDVTLDILRKAELIGLNEAAKLVLARAQKAINEDKLEAAAALRDAAEEILLRCAQPMS